MDLDYELVMQTFAAEAEEQLAVMEQGLVAIESDPQSAELLASVFRAAHTLKGNASSVGLPRVAEQANAIEDSLAAMRAGRLAVDSALISALLTRLDTLRRTLGESMARDAAEREPAALGQAVASTQTLRIDAAKLDRMLSLSGEISIARGRLRAQLASAGPDAIKDALESHLEADRLYRELQDEIMRARLVPLGPIFRQYQRVVRDLALAQGKRVELVVEGEDVEIDTALSEQIRAPLTHMLRNAIDHGIEPPEQRRGQGKDPLGRIRLSARREASSIVIELQDDGAGFNRRKIAARAGLAGGALSDAELFRMVLAPGFSTAETVTELSGRGVGMDVVRKNVEALRGSLSITSSEGLGSTITLRLPLTLAIIDGFFVTAGSETYVIPLETVTECQELQREEARHADGCGVFDFRGQALPYLRLRELFALSGEAPAREHIAVVKLGERLAGIAVDALLGQDQAVIKPLGKVFQNVPAVAGATITGNGRVALILDVPTVLRLAEVRAGSSAGAKETRA